MSPKAIKTITYILLIWCLGMAKIPAGMCKVLKYKDGRTVKICRTKEGKIVWIGPYRSNEVTITLEEYRE